MNPITISPCPVEDLDQVRPLLAAANQKPYRFLARDLRSDLDEFWLRELAAGIEDGADLLVATAGAPARGASVVPNAGPVVGMVSLAPLPWETKILGIPMGTLKHLVVAPPTASYSASSDLADYLLKAATQRAVEQGFHSLLCKVYTDDIPSIHTLESNGFRLVDTLLDFIYDYRKATKAPPTPVGVWPVLSEAEGSPNPASGRGDEGVHVRLATPEDEASLLDLARISFANHFGRFHSDPGISRDDATNIYVEWIRSCARGYADWILLVEIDGKLAGYSAWKKPSAREKALPVRVGHYSIAAVHPDYSGRGLFSILTQSGMELLAGTADVIEGPTHINNYPVQRGYANLRWRIGDAHHSFQKWLI